MHDLAKIFIRCLNHWKLETPTARKQRVTDDELQKYKANYARFQEYLFSQDDAQILFLTL